MQWLKDIFTGPKGEGSMKRLIAFICLGVAIFVAIYRKDVANAGLFLGAATALMGIAAATKS